VVEGRAKGRRYKVDETATLGRSPEATILLADPEISRLHAKVTRTADGKFEIVDLSSRNGTFVNGEPVTHRILSYGDRIRLGPNTVLEFYAFDATEELIIQRQRFESIGRLGVGISHDLNNVLAALDTGTAYLLNLPPNTPVDHRDVRECLADMSLASARAAELTRSILSFVRGRGHAHVPVDLSALLHELARMLRRTFERSVTLNLDVTDGVIVHGSRSELHQVLLNLCLNARDAMPYGGCLTLSARVITTPQEAPIDSANVPLAKLTVSDTGYGMDEATASRIFEPFYTTKQAGAGYGLGLATVREIVTGHGGQVTVDSAIGKGTRFSLFLPALQPTLSDSVRSTEKVAFVDRTPQIPLSILLVDDEALVRRALARRLRQAGYQVLEADNGKDAVRCYREQKCEFVVLDLDMPDLDGEQTHRQLVAVNPHVRVAYVTGYVDTLREQRLRRLGAIAVFEKPCRLEELLSVARAPSSHWPDDETDDDSPTIT
jgi:signal transduction histidine kinase/CheY-like chemotaxis protein